jgi:hypothetical protein
VTAGDLICVVEAMKMENEIVSSGDGVVAQLAVAPAIRSRTVRSSACSRASEHVARAVADLSELAGEPLGATATHAENWLLVELPGTWHRDVGGGAGLPEAARRAASEWLERTPSSRLLFIRRPGRARPAAALAFVVHAGESRRVVRRFELVSPGDVSEVDLVGGGEETDAELVSCVVTERATPAARSVGRPCTARSLPGSPTTSSGSRRTRAATASQPTCWSFLPGSTSAASHRRARRPSSRMRSPGASTSRTIAGAWPTRPVCRRPSWRCGTRRGSRRSPISHSSLSRMRSSDSGA